MVLDSKDVHADDHIILVLDEELPLEEYEGGDIFEFNGESSNILEYKEKSKACCLVIIPK